jgi:flavin reductase (DIM6/NTAB) family NADH-FMN oxidoreductase RutF
LASHEEARRIAPGEISRRDRYQLLTSLVVPRPIGWISTWSASGRANLAPFSFFNALATSPMLVGVSIGERADRPKDTLVNIRERGAYCVNVVSQQFLEAMNRTSAEVGPEVDEFELAGLARGESMRVDAPFVANCPAVLECEVRQEVDLGGAGYSLLIGEVVGVRLSPRLPFKEGTMSVAPEALMPVGRLSGAGYMLPGSFQELARP